MAKKLVFTVFLALVLGVGFAAYAQDTYQYGGSTDPLGLGNDPTKAPAATGKPARAASPVYLSGTGPINLRPNAYMAHQPQDPAAQDPSAVQKPKPTSAIIYNQNLQQQKKIDALDQSPFPPGWGDYPFK